MVLGAGLLLAFLTLIAEVLCKRKRKQKVIENSKRDLYTFKNIKIMKNDSCLLFLTKESYSET